MNIQLESDDGDESLIDDVVDGMEYASENGVTTEVLVDGMGNTKKDIGEVTTAMPQYVLDDRESEAVLVQKKQQEKTGFLKIFL